MPQLCPSYANNGDEPADVLVRDVAYDPRLLSDSATRRARRFFLAPTVAARRARRDFTNSLRLMTHQSFTSRCFTPPCFRIAAIGVASSTQNCVSDRLRSCGSRAATVGAYFPCERRSCKRQKRHSLFSLNGTSSNRSGDRSLGVLASSSAIDPRICLMSSRTPSLCRK